MSVAEARTELAAALKPALGKQFAIFPAPESLDEITKPTLHLFRTRVEKLPQAPMGFHLNSFALWVIAPANASEDTLDDLLEDVLEALDSSTDSLWSDAERDIYGDPGNPAYRITLQTHSNRKDG